MGGLGQTSAINNYFIQNIIQEFRAFNSNDRKFKDFNQLEFITTAQTHFREPMNINNCLEWLNVLRRNTILYGVNKCWYMKCRDAITELSLRFSIKVRFKLTEGQFELEVSNPTLARTFTNLSKKNIGEYIREMIGLQYFEIWAETTAHGSTVRLTGQSKYSSLFMTNATFPERAMKFAIMARNNLLDLNFKPMNRLNGYS